MPRRRSAACHSGCSLHADDRVQRLAEQQRRAHARRATVHERTSPCGDRDDDLDRLEPRAGRHEQRLDLAVDGRARLVREHDGLVGLVQAHVHEHRVDLEAVVGRDERDRVADLVGGDRVERVRGAGHSVDRRLLLAHVLRGSRRRSPRRCSPSR